MKKLLSMMAGLLLTAISVYSQAPAIFNYQGVARNSVGNALINKTITLRLTIHDATAGGAIVYQESRITTTNPFGLFNVQVGSPGATSVTGTIPGVNWAVNAKFIQVEIDPNGGSTFINIGTAQIASVPYAWYSAVSGDLTLPYNKTQADNGTLFKITNSGNASGSTALEGLTNSTAANAFAIIGTVTSVAPGANSTGVRGINNGTGALGIGVWGSHNGGGWGVYGTSVSGIGVRGEATSGSGVYGTSGTGRGGFFEVTNPANVSDAIRAETNGAGASWAIRAISSGANGAGLFQQTNATNTANNLQSNQGGLGRAGLFNSTNAANTANAVEINVAGTGFGLRIASTNGAPKALQTAGGLQFTGIGEALNKILASDAVGNATWQTLAAIGGVTGSGTLNYVPKWTPTGTNLGNSQIFDNGTSIGINTNVPNAAYRLEVQGIQRINNTTLQEGGELRFQEGTLFGAPNHWIIDNFESFAGGNKFRIWNDIGGMNLQMLPNNKTAVGNMVFSDQPQSTLDVEGNLAVGVAYSGTTAAPANGMIVEGNVGIGTPTPTAKLHLLNSSVAALGSLLVNQSNAANTAIGVNIFNANTSSIGYGNGAVYAQRGAGSLAATYLYTGIATAITGVAASTQGFGVQGTSESGYGVTGLSFSGIGVHGINLNAGNAARFENALNAGNVSPVVFVNNISTVGNSYGVHSVVSSTTPGGSSAAIRGQNNGLGGSGIGVWGSQDGSGWGVYGVTPDGLGVYGRATNNGYGVQAIALNGIGTYSFSQNWYGVWGETNSTNGPNTAGTLGYASNGTSVGFTRGIWGYNNATNNDGAGGLFQHVSGGYGVYSAAGNLGVGVYGVTGLNGTGVFGQSFGVNSRSVRGLTDLGIAGYFENTDPATINGTVYASTVTTTGNFFQVGAVYAQAPINAVTSLFAGPTAVKGVSSFSTVVGAQAGFGVQGSSNAGFGVAGLTSDGTALYGHALTINGYALRTFGKLQFQGQGAAANRILTSINASGDAIWQSPSAVGIVSGSGTLNFVPKWTPNGTTLGNSQIFDNGFAVGIGTAIPGFKVHIADNFPELLIQDIDDVTSISLIPRGAGYSGGVGTRGNNDLPLFTNNLDRVTVQAGTGYVGVGNTVPTNRFEVIHTDPTARAGFFQINNPANLSTALEVSTNGVARAIFAQSNAPGFCNCGVIDGLTTVTGANALYGRGAGTNTWGVYGLSDNSAGVAGIGWLNGSVGVYGQGWLGSGGQFFIDNTIGGNTSNALEVSNLQTGKAANMVINNAASTSDVLFATTNSTSTTPAAVHAQNGSSGLPLAIKKAVWGESNNGVGVYGSSASGFGLYANSFSSIAGRFQNTNAANTANVLEVVSNSTSTFGSGIRVTMPLGVSFDAGVRSVVTGAGANAIIGEANNGPLAWAIVGISATGRAGQFMGDVDVVGTLSKSAGAFKIDHPLDPANKYLIHSFVESPDMMNVYNGNVKTDGSGRAVVTLPSYFEAENIDYKYQLTIVDETQFAMARVSKKVANNQFEIMTDKPGIEVSWQVTGVRNDLFAQKNRIINEVPKTGREAGKYILPELYGKPKEMGVYYKGEDINKNMTQTDKTGIGANQENLNAIKPLSNSEKGKTLFSSLKPVENVEYKTPEMRYGGLPVTPKDEKLGANKTIVSKDQPAKEAVKTESTAVSTELQLITMTPEELQAEKQAKLAADKNKAEELKKIQAQKPVVPENSKIKTDQGKTPPAETKPVETPAKLEAAPAKSN